MSDYAETVRRHARLTMLRLLEDAPRYTSNVSMMTQLLQSFGISYGRDQVEGEATWLEEQGLVTLEYICICKFGVGGVGRCFGEVFISGQGHGLGLWLLWVRPQLW